MVLQGKRNKKSKTIKQTDSTLRKGLMLLEEKLFKQAIVELKIALENNPKPVKAELEDLFELYKSKEDIARALALGMVLYHVKKDEDLAMQLAEYSRKQGDYKQANNLYRQILKKNRSNKLALYNLAASMGEINRYDDEIPKLIEQFFNPPGLVLPEYISERNTIADIQANLKNEYLKTKQVKLAKLEETIQAKIAAGDDKAAEKLIQELNLLIDESEKVDYATTKEALLGKIKRELEQGVQAEDRPRLYQDIFNFALFVAKNREADLGLEHFLVLKEKGVQIEDLDLCVATTYAMLGRRSDAITILTDRVKREPENRILNINLAQLHKIEGNRLLSYKYQIISASLLEKSDGLVQRSEIVNKADFHFKQGKMDKALKLYKIVVQEKKDINAWLKIGEIHLAKKRQLEALDTFKEMKRVYPDSPVVQNKLIEVHNTICQQADEYFNQTKFKQAAIIYERALKLVQTADTIKKLISVYKQLHKSVKVQALYEELNRMAVQEVAEKKSEKHQELINNGKQALRVKDYESAIICFENAFNIRPNKDVFVYLAQIYKGLNRKSVLRDLVERWNIYKTDHVIESP